MSKGAFQTLTSFGRNECCQLCLTKMVREVELGPIYKKANIIVHYYCLLMASRLEQNGSDKQGILGFLIKDIKKEITRVSGQICYYCKKAGATVMCSTRRCNKWFHMPCGQAQGSLHQFFKNFKSFCSTHRPRQRIPLEIKKLANNVCIVCACRIKIDNPNSYLWPQCCRAATFFHRECIQKMATSAGYYFKCPLCNNSEDFQATMHINGIYIPEQEAAWEQEPNAYEELLVRRNECEAEICQCTKGRTYSKNNSDWQIEVCRMCGGSGTHLKCCGGSWSAPKRRDINWTCSICSSIGQDMEGSQQNISQASMNRSLTADSPDSDDSVCIVLPTSSSVKSESSDVIVIVDSDSDIDIETISDSSEEFSRQMRTLRKRKFTGGQEPHTLPKRIKQDSPRAR